jgi:N-acetyl-gamma-glutamyl-phosphate reductase
LLDAGRIVIDLSADFRLRSAAVYKEFYAHDHPAPDLLDKAVYGLPEIYRDEIKKSVLIASPGCYPTSILLPLIPLLHGGVDQASRHHRRLIERRERRGPQGRGGLPVLRMQ